MKPKLFDNNALNANKLEHQQERHEIQLIFARAWIKMLRITKRRAYYQFSVIKV